MPDYRVRSSVICLQDDHILALKHQSPGSPPFWGVPGGRIESHETPLQAALRETCEETGYAVELLYDPAFFIEYEFTWQHNIVHCRTHWFAVRPEPSVHHVPRAGDEEFITGMRWIPIANRSALFAGYPVIQDAIEEVFRRMKDKGLINL